MTMAKVESGVVTSTRIPTVGRLTDGRSVSNYHRLEPTILAAEGWLPLIEDKPAFSMNTHALTFKRYEIGAEGVTAVYEAVPVEPAGPGGEFGKA